MDATVTHMIGLAVRVNDRLIQRCILCGEKLLDQSTTKFNIDPASQCVKDLMAAGRTYPRTCRVCGLGECLKGYHRAWTPNNTVGEGPNYEHALPVGRLLRVGEGRRMLILDELSKLPHDSCMSMIEA